jgi:hypothetical protein
MTSLQKSTMNATSFSRMAVFVAGALFSIGIFCSACSLAAPREKRIPISSLSIVALGPIYRDGLSIRATNSSDLRHNARDLFQFALLYGEPPIGNYDWFKIARSNNETRWYLVLGSKDGSKEWVEPGTLLRDEKNEKSSFILERELGGEGNVEKSIRRIEWSGDNPGHLSVTLNVWSRIFLNPVWGAPSTLRVEMTKDFR